MKTIVLDIQRNSFLDGPGIRTTVFLKGCCLRCRWCHNPESFLNSPQTVMLPHGIKKRYGQEMSVEEVFAIVKRDKPFYDESGGGVTLSGGEPALFPRFVAELFRLCHRQGINTAVETNGYPPWKNFAYFVKDTDIILFDYKLTDPYSHQYWTGAELAPILANLKQLVNLNKKIILRCPLIPKVNTDEDHLKGIVNLANTYKLPVQLMPFHSTARDKWKALGLNYEFEQTPSMSETELEEIIGKLLTLGLAQASLIFS